VIKKDSLRQVVREIGAYDIETKFMIKAQIFKDKV
jgi:hypothetical protein